jgi:cell division protein ZapA
VPQVTITIAGRTYRMACGEGEEAHLEKLAALFDGKIEEMRGSFGEIGDMRLHVMAAVMVADDFTETKRKLEAIESEVASLRAQAAASEERASARDAQLADALTKTAERIERVAKNLNTPLNATSEA